MTDKYAEARAALADLRAGIPRRGEYPEYDREHDDLDKIEHALLEPPTNDEREALAQFIYDWTNNPQDRKSLGDYDVNSLTDALLAAGFRQQAPAHEWIRVEAERAGEISLTCACGLTWKHLPLKPGQHATLPPCPEEQS